MVELDTNVPAFTGSIQLPVGEYKGKRIREIADTTKGLLYLEEIVKGPAFISRMIQTGVEKFITEPCYAMQLQQLHAHPG